MDIHSERGRRTREDEDKAVALWHSRYPDFRYIHSNKDEPAKADSMIVCDGVIYAVAEMKCRYDLTVEKFERDFRREWLVTFQKVVDCVAVAESFRVPFVGMLYLVEARTLFFKEIWNPKDGYVCPFSVRQSETQRTVNGGKAIRANAYLDMSGAKYIRQDDERAA